MTLIQSISYSLQTSAPYLMVALIVIGIVLIVLVVRLQIKLRRVLIGKNARTLEDSIVTIHKGWETERQFKEEMQKYLLEVERRLSRSLRGADTVRFNAFQLGSTSGGNQSFATALVDEKGNGVVFSTLNARERVSVFAKPVKNWKADIELTPEEIESLDRVKKAS